MISCCCSLAGTRACDSCPNGPSRGSSNYFPIPMSGQRIIEKYQYGKLVERIVENPTLTTFTLPGFQVPGPNIITPLKDSPVDLSNQQQGGVQ